MARVFRRSKRSPGDEFVRTEVAGGLALVLAGLAGFVLANTEGHDAYEDLLTASVPFVHDVHGLVNDGLMAIFFFVVGLEITRELERGELRDRRAALVPAGAALGGMVVPALIYLAVAGGPSTGDGWGIPMATDIAFALGVLALVGRRLPSSVRVFLLSLAIVDDIGAIAVIAIFYSDAVDLVYLGLGAAGIGLFAVLTRLGHPPARGYLVLATVVGVAAWAGIHESGVHATIAGVALGIALPDELGEPLEHRLHPISSFVVVPLFAFFNAGVVVDTEVLEAPGAKSVALAVVLGLVIGKPLGVLGGTWLVARSRWGTMPAGAGWGDLAAAAMVAGIGFTVSLFVADLAFGDEALTAAAKLGVLIASILAAAAGTGLLAWSARRPERSAHHASNYIAES